jgi:hypothetical protein
MRTALGYDTGTLELDFEQGLRTPGILPRLLMRMIWRFPRTRALRPWHILPRRKSSLALMELDDAMAQDSRFFVDFWNEARWSRGWRQGAIPPTRPGVSGTGLAGVPR